jgi:hypothetical protein
MLKTQEKDKLWDLRQRQNLAELMPLLAQYKLQYPEDQELLCLDASLLRARGAIDGAQEKLKQLRTEVAQEALNPRLFMEEGLNFLYQGDSYQGLEKFLTCFSLIKNRPEEINLAMQALINAMISLDNLGQSFAYTESEFTKITFNKTIPQNYTSTIEMLHLYKKFRQGDMASIDRQVVSKAGQAQFFKYYISSMPYHRFYLPKSVAAEMEGILINTSELYLKSYRFRTLQKILHPDDEKSAK